MSACRSCPDISLLPLGAARADRWPAVGAHRSTSPFLLRSVEPPIDEAVGQRVVGSSPARQADRRSASRTTLPRDPPDDRRPVALEADAARKPPASSAWPRSTSTTGTLAADRGGHEEARLAARRARRGRARASSIPAGSRCSTSTLDAVPRGAAQREPHAQARADRPAPLQRHRQRVLRRDPAPRAAVAGDADAAARATRRSRACIDATLRGARGVDRAPARRESGDDFPEKVTAFRPEMAVHGRYGKPCPVCGTPGAAHPLRRQRDELLPALPDRRQAARRPLAVAAAERRLAEDDRGARAAAQRECRDERCSNSGRA